MSNNFELPQDNLALSQDVSYRNSITIGYYKCICVRCRKKWVQFNKHWPQVILWVFKFLTKILKGTGVGGKGYLFFYQS